MGGHPVDVHVGRQLRFFRLRSHLSQGALASRVGVTFQQVQKYEKGVNRIGASRLLAFSQILDVPIQDFFNGYEGSSASGDEAAHSVPPSKLDHEIFHFASQCGDGPIKRRIRDLLVVLATGRDEAQPHEPT